jgi:hypothetical protein
VISVNAVVPIFNVMKILCILLSLLVACEVLAQKTVKLNPNKTPSKFEALHASINPLTYEGRKAIKVLGSKDGVGEPMIRLNDITFRNGTIEAWIAGKPMQGAFADARGYVGIAFRVSGDNKNFECFYLRPTNGRSDDQVRRNHSVQYTSTPDYPWDRLRAENREKYESYADIVTGAWTKIRIVVKGEKAFLYVHDAQQPNLIVNDLKRGADVEGGIAFWIGLDTEGYFSDIRITNDDKN